jgi:hypothetical protein
MTLEEISIFQVTNNFLTNKIANWYNHETHPKPHCYFSIKIFISYFCVINIFYK